MDKLLYPIRYVYASIIDGQIKHVESPWLTKVTATMGTTLLLYFIVTGVLSGCFWLLNINIVEHWHLLANRVDVSYLVISILEGGALSLVLVYYACINKNRYLLIFKKLQSNTDSQLKRMLKVVSIALVALSFAFICMVLFL